MATFLLRVALPDRPGALGAVASRIGSLQADVIAVDILGRERGRAVDEFVVDLGDERHVSLLLDEIAEVDGVVVDEVRVLPVEVVDRRAAAFDAAVAIMGVRSTGEVLQAVADHARRGLDAAWAAAVDTKDGQDLAVDGDAPAAPWLAAYMAGTRWLVGTAAGSAALPGTTAPDTLAPDTTGTAGTAGPDTLAPDTTAAAGTTAPDTLAPDTTGTGAPGHGEAPITGQRHPRCAPRANAVVPDVAWARLDAWDLVVVVGRPARAFTQAERRHLAGIARLADARWADLAERDARSSHPSRRPAAPRPARTP